MCRSMAVSRPRQPRTSRMPEWQPPCRSRRSKMRHQVPSQLPQCSWLILSALIDTFTLKMRRSWLSLAVSVLLVELSTKNVTHVSKDQPSLKGFLCLTHQSQIERTHPISASTTRSNLRLVARAEQRELQRLRPISFRTLAVPTSAAGEEVD